MYRIDKLYKEPDIVKFIKIYRLKWAGHVMRMKENHLTRRLFVVKLEGIRQRRRPRLRQEDGVEGD